MIPKDAREVYLNESGEPIAFCPKEGIGLTDLERGQFYRANQEGLIRHVARAMTKGKEDGSEYVVVCIDVDDPTWTWLADALMPGHDWRQYRDRGERPVARGVVPREITVETIGKCYPAALPVPDGPFVAVFAAGGVSVFGKE